MGVDDGFAVEEDEVVLDVEVEAGAEVEPEV